MQRILVLIAVIIGIAAQENPSVAGPFADGDMISYSQNTWGADPLGGPPASLITAHFDSLYPTGLEVGSTNYMLFTSGSNGDSLLSYLPSTGPASALNAILVDPLSSSSGIYGGQVVGLKLNIDFSDAGYTRGALNVPFGDLVLQNLTGSLAGLNGDNLRQFLAINNLALGGDSTGYAIADLSSLLQRVNGSFEGGFVTPFSDELALPSATDSIPEPSTLQIIVLGVLAIGAMRFKGQWAPI